VPRIATIIAEMLHDRQGILLGMENPPTSSVALSTTSFRFIAKTLPQSAEKVKRFFYFLLKDFRRFSLTGLNTPEMDNKLAWFIVLVKFINVIRRAPKDPLLY
jgi:hypothetical protein